MKVLCLHFSCSWSTLILCFVHSHVSCIFSGCTVGTTVLDSSLGKWTSGAMERFQTGPISNVFTLSKTGQLLWAQDVTRPNGLFLQQVQGQHFSTFQAAAHTGAFPRRTGNDTTSDGGQERQSGVLDLQWGKFHSEWDLSHPPGRVLTGSLLLS